MSKIQFCIKNWYALAPGKTNKEDWRQGDSEPTPPPSDLIPSVMRRRMSSLSKMAVQTALSLTRELRPDFVIFSSRHSELPRTVLLVEAILRGEDASPIAFSQSVHNTASGLYTIAAGHAVPVTSVSAGEDSLHAGLIEAAAYLACHPQHTVMLVDFDEPTPAPYDRFENQLHQGYALGILLNAGDDIQIERLPAQALDPRPQALCVIDSLSQQLTNWTVNGRRHAWRWQR